nr:ATP-binding domain-containing protein [Rhodococcus corynebacterioides]
MLYRRLDELRAYAKSRLGTVLLETGGTPQARSERESFTALYTEDLAKYDSSENGLCFGRIDVQDDDAPRYIGRLGILDEDNDFDSLLYDWRAPLARPFYLATPAAPEGVRRRRHLRTRARRVTGVADEYLDLDAARDAGVEIGSDGVAGESALLSALNAARTGQMTDIVETIQREQDDIIRSTHRSVLVVQGGPGTGKTAVALHRAAYLLYTYRQQLDKSGVLVIGPNSTFLDYIGQVLPSLGETGVLLATVGTLFPGVDASRSESAREAELKGDLAIVDVLVAAVRDRQEVPREPVVVRFDGYPLRIDRKTVTRARGRARSSRRPHNLARPIFVSTMIDLLADQFAAQVGGDVLGGANLLSREDLADTRDEMRADPDIARELARLWPELTAQQVLADLLASPERLRTATPTWSDDDRAAVARSDDGRFAPSDAPLLDELAELLGTDDAAERERERRRWRAEIEDAQGALDILTGSAPQDLEDELDPEILMAYDLVDADRLAQRHENTRRLTAAERAAGDRTWTYGHVIVDEAQELSPMAWRMVMRRIPNRWMTLVGDVAQTGAPAGTSNWQDVLGPYVARRWKLTELTVNYRTPAAIMELAHRVLAVLDPEATPPRPVRDGTEVPRADRVAPEDLVDAVGRHVAAHPRPGTSAVLAPLDLVESLQRWAGPDVTVCTVREAKGLEFDSVLLVEPAAIAADSARGLNDLYVALTRATQRVDIVHAAPLPDVLGVVPEYRPTQG